MSLLYSVLASFVILFSTVSFATAEEKKPEPAKQPQAAPAPQAQAPTAVEPKAEVKAKTEDACPCLKPGIDLIQKAYNSLEEDEWKDAENASKNAQTFIMTLAATCKCPEVASYQKIADAYLKYAQGGNHLDGADQPDCPYALKLYTDAISNLKDAIPNITNSEVKTSATNIQDYADEELQFVKDECEDVKAAPAKPAAAPAKKS